MERPKTDRIVGIRPRRMLAPAILCDVSGVMICRIQLPCVQQYKRTGPKVALAMARLTVGCRHLQRCLQAVLSMSHTSSGTSEATVRHSQRSGCPSWRRLVHVDSNNHREGGER